jgi:hypothetical protein
MVDDEERAAVARARWRAVREGVGLVLIVLFVAGVYTVPLGLILLRDFPQLSVLMPEPARRVTLAVGGLPSAADVLSEGADGDDDEAEVAEPPDAPPPASAPPPAPAVAQADVGTPAPAPSAEPAATEPTPAPPAEPAPPPQPKDDEAVAEARARKKGRSGKCGEPHPDIVEVEPGHWEIQRSLVEYYGSSVERFNSLGYSRRYEGEDGTKGWQVGGFGCQSPLWKAGLRSKDVLQAINGRKTNNVVQLFGIWLGQRNKDDFVLEILRKDRPLTLHYTLVGDRKRRKG